MIEKILMNEIFKPVIVIVVGLLSYLFIKKIIKKALKVNVKGVDARKQKTLTILFLNLAKFFISIIAILTILELYGFDTKTILASLGVFAAVAGLALQDLLKDFVSGIYIMLEGQFKVGDVITIGTFKGEVTYLSMKSTRVKAYTGEVKIFTNRNITEVINHTLDHSLAIVDIDVAYDSDLEKVEKTLNSLCEKLSNELDNLLGPITLLGINEMKDSGITYRITVDTKPMEHFAIQRILMKEIKMAFDKKKIVIPFPQLVIHNGK